jgi:hypothetical protein
MEINRVEILLNLRSVFELYKHFMYSKQKQTLPDSCNPLLWPIMADICEVFVTSEDWVFFTANFKHTQHLQVGRRTGNVLCSLWVALQSEMRFQVGGWGSPPFFPLFLSYLFISVLHAPFGVGLLSWGCCHPSSWGMTKENSFLLVILITPSRVTLMSYVVKTPLSQQMGSREGNRVKR